MVYCIKCGAQNSDDVKNCTECGFELYKKPKEGSTQCWKCGLIYEKRVICPNCDAPARFARAQYIVCHFQEPKIVHGRGPHYGFNCALSTHGTAASLGAYYRACYPELCPMYQTWKLLEKQHASLKTN